MNPLNSDNYPITSVTIDPVNWTTLIVTVVAVGVVAGAATYFAVHFIRKRREAIRLNQSLS
jgi:heme/copper-type cytochrome/quinol oxidase subunit 2